MTILPADLGEGATLRRLTLEDLEQIWATVERECERLAPWMPWVEHVTTIEDERTWLSSVMADQGSLEGCGLFIGGRYAGGAGLRLDPFAIEGDVGYWIAAEHEGRGHVTRAVRVLIQVGFEDLGLNRIVIRAGVANLRSRAIPERLGFTREGVARGAGRGTGGFYDLVVYSMLRDEWPRP